MDEIARSRVIKFVVGPEKVEFNVHEASVTWLSRPLSALLTSGMQESVEARVVWDDVEPGTFTKFLEYAYSGSFTVPDEEIQSKKRNFMSLRRKIKTHRLLTENLGPEFIYAIQHFEHCNASSASSANAEATSEANLSTTTAQSTMHSKTYYLAHARLYILAEKYCIPVLRTLCVERVQQSLLDNPRERDLVFTLVDMIRYVWPRTMPNDAFRKLLLRYAITNMRWIMSTRTFIKNLKDLPEVCQELLTMIPMTYWGLL
ncbi:Putative BTB/POZ domain-containing protein [Colletotrichum destructivum]|uniref:BTB/POZ domain-containing protein n=1 Tax=Colletotrichum destructivum TaxID=34406 RepID=A0AAX4IRH9_9PEZI|nr:Putative BTB/POZ domain-containing protein [Colletotrichum destructivum]